MPIVPTFDYEQQYWDAEIARVAGVDEVGMGALAGPVVAAAVIFEPGVLTAKRDAWPAIRDSKSLSAAQREKSAVFIQEMAVAWAVGEASVVEITELNIRQASHVAMRRAIDGLRVRPDMALIDGNPVALHDEIPAEALVKGDQLSVSIAAASIVAKVYRDRVMMDLDAQFPAYGFASHKGYGAAQHLAALAEHGACSHHRASYAPVARALAKTAASAAV